MVVVAGPVGLVVLALWAWWCSARCSGCVLGAVRWVVVLCLFAVHGSVSCGSHRCTTLLSKEQQMEVAITLTSHPCDSMGFVLRVC